MASNAAPLLTQTKRLFGRLPRKYGLQDSNNNYSSQTADLTDETLKAHFNETITIDIKGGEENSYAAYDIDIKSDYLDDQTKIPKKLLTHLKNVTREISQKLGLLGIKHFGEDSGRRGSHIWIFFTEALPVQNTVAILNHVIKDLDTPKEIGIEIKPRYKGDGLRLFGGVHKATGTKSKFINPDFQEYKGAPDEYLSQVLVNPADDINEMLAEIADTLELQKNKTDFADSELDMYLLSECEVFRRSFEKVEGRVNLDHLERKTLAMTIMPLKSDNLRNQLKDLFSKLPNFDEQLTDRSLDVLTFDRCIGCRKIMEYGLCKGPCDSIRGHKIKSPSRFILENPNRIKLPEYIKIPSPYKITSEGIKLSQTDKEGFTMDKTLSHTPMWVNSQTKDLEEGIVGVEVSYYPSSKEKPSKINVPKRTVSDKNQILTLANYDLDITSNNNGGIIEYFSNQYQSSKEALPKKYITSKSGWVDYDGSQAFILGPNIYKPDKLKDVSFEFNPVSQAAKVLNKGIKSIGTLDGWIAAVKPLVNYRNFVLGLGAAFAAPLLPIINIPNLIIHYMFESTKGKTFLMQVCLSVFGFPADSTHPNSLIKQWRGTDNAIEGIAYAYNNFLLPLDEAGQIDLKSLERIIYMLANGQGKVRAKTDGESRMQKNFNQITLSTGEVSLLSKKSTTGKEVRYIEVTTPPFAEDDTDKRDFVDSTKEIIMKNYGHAGQVYLQELVDIVNEEERRSALYAVYKAKLAVLTKLSVSPFHARNAAHYAAMWLGVEVADSLLNLFDDKDQIEKTFIKLYQEAGEKWKTNITTVEQAIKYIWDAIESQSLKFENHAPDKLGKKCTCQGYKDAYAFYESKLDQLLIDGAYDPKSIKKFFKEKGYLVLDKDKSLPQVKLDSNSKKRMYVFHKDLVSHIYEELSENDVDKEGADEFSSLVA